MAGILHLILTVIVTVTFVKYVDSQFGTWPDTCLDDKNKGAPSKETETFPECERYQDFGCCSADYARDVHDHGTGGMQFLTSICGEFSDDCKKYLIANGCFFRCEPMLRNFQHPTRKNAPHQAPICKSYCDAWFEACKNDTTCVGDWKEGFVVNPDSRNCPANGSTCVTYEEMYENGQGLCETIYGTNYRYEASDKDCLVMNFDGENPNVHGDPYGKNSANKMVYSLVVNVFALQLFNYFF